MDKLPKGRGVMRSKPQGPLRAGTQEPPKLAGGSVCAVVVAFFSGSGLADYLRSLLPQVGAVVVVDNTPPCDCAPGLSLPTESDRLQVIENRANRGIAAALNQGLERALQMGYRWILTLDQDSRCNADMVWTLLQAWGNCDPRPAIVGGNYFDPRNGRTAIPPGETGEFLERRTVITSGSLVDADVARSVGGFREDFFIDQVDHEFCLRLRAHGYRVVMSRKPTMVHSVGRPGGPRLPFIGMTFPNHSPLRKYYIARNSVVLLKEYWRREPEWCLRRFIRLVLGLGSMATLEKHRFAKVRAFGAGVADGVCARMGPCRREWIYRVG